MEVVEEDPVVDIEEDAEVVVDDEEEEEREGERHADVSALYDRSSVRTLGNSRASSGSSGSPVRRSAAARSYRPSLGFLLIMAQSRCTS